MSLQDKFVNVRHWGQCSKCHKFRELRCGWNETLSDIIAVCDQCFVLHIDEDAFDLIFEKAGVPGPKRHLVTAQSFTDATRARMADKRFNLERIFPEEDDLVL